MKKILTILAILVCSFSFSQRERILSTEFYKDVNSRLMNEKIIIFDSINKQELMNRFENWAGTNFRNYSEVRTSKTDNKIVLDVDVILEKILEKGIDSLSKKEREFLDNLNK